jgi:hypothetical protein
MTICIQDLNLIFYYLPITKMGTHCRERTIGIDDDKVKKSSIIFHVIYDNESSTGPNKVRSCKAKEGNNIILVLWFSLRRAFHLPTCEASFSSTQVHLHRSKFFSDYDSLKLV